MDDGLIDRANYRPRAFRQGPLRSKFERHSSTTCRLTDQRGENTVAYVDPYLLEAIVAAGRTEELVDALTCARRLALDEGFRAGRDDVRSDLRALLGLPHVGPAPDGA